MKGTMFAIVCLLFISSSIAQNLKTVCYTPQYSCSPALGACSAVYNHEAKTTTYTVCSNNQHCNATYNTEDNSYTGNCVVPFAVGAECTVLDKCVDGAFCVENVCTEVKVVALNGECDSTVNLCQNNLYCDKSNNTCQIAPTNGQNCTSDIPCVPGFVCNSEDVCIAAYSLAAGAECSILNQNIDCAVGLGCAMDSTFKYVCQAPAASSGTACTGPTDTTCPTGEYCTARCNATADIEYTCQNTIVANTAEDKDDYEDLAECKLEHLTNVCSSSASATCAQCFDDACDYVYDEKDTCGNGICGDTPATTDDATTTTTSDASLLSLSVFSLACALLLAM